MMIITTPCVLFEHLNPWMPVILPLFQYAELLQENLNTLYIVDAKINIVGNYEISVKNIFYTLYEASNSSMIKEGFLALNQQTTGYIQIEISNISVLNQFNLN